VETFPVFISWKGFELDFVSKFCPKNEAMVALTKLESTWYYHERKSVDDYIDEFSELVEEAGYSDGLSIVMKFWKGLDRWSRIGGNRGVERGRTERQRGFRIGERLHTVDTATYKQGILSWRHTTTTNSFPLVLDSSTW